MESATLKNLMQLKGVGKVSAQRLAAAGFDDFAKIAAAGKEGLRAVPGLHPRSIAAIRQQAEELALAPGAPAEGEAAAGMSEAKAARLVRVQQLFQQLQKEVSGLMTLERAAEMPAKGEKFAALHQEAVKLGKVLDQLEAALPARLKRTGKALVKADRRVAEVVGRGPKKAASSLKKARKSLKKVLN
jgi:hypothetical protein